MDKMETILYLLLYLLRVADGAIKSPKLIEHKPFPIPLPRALLF